MLAARSREEATARILQKMKPRHRPRALLRHKQMSGQDKGFSDSTEWIEKRFWIPELNGPIKLFSYQKAVLEEAHRTDGNGDFVYSIVVWSDIKKSAKSTIAAAVALYRAHRSPWGNIKIVANDLKQADSRVAYYLRRAIELSPHMKDLKQARYLTTLPNHATIEAIPIDPGGEAGGNDDLIIFSELWAAKHKAIQQMWAEMTISPTKFGRSQRWVETYAGYVGESPLLERLYEQGVKHGRRIDLDFKNKDDYPPLEVYANGPMLCLWNTVPRCKGERGWQTKEYYASEAAVLTTNEFQRIHRNQWVSSVDTFVPPEWWAACYDNNLPPLGASEPIVVAMDAGVTDDSFGLVAASRHPADSDHVVTRYARRWLPPKGGKIRYNNPDDLGDRDTPEGELRWLIDNYNVVMVAYDPYQLEDMAGRLTQEGLAWFYAFSQGKERMTADSTLRTLIRDRRMHHDGNQQLTEHVQNAAAKTDGDDSKVRIVKKSPTLKVDLAVALSMAASQCLRLNL